MCVCTLSSHSVVSDFLSPFGLLPARLLCPWDCPGKNTGVGCHALLQGIFWTQGWSLCLLYLLHCRLILYLLSHRGRQGLPISPPLTPWQPLTRFLFLWFCLRMTLQREFPTTSPFVPGTVTGAGEAGWQTVSELWASERVLCALRDGWVLSK